MLRSLALRRRPGTARKTVARFEALESRACPAVLLDLSAATAALANVSFTDGGGNITNIKLGGTSGNVSITSDESVLVNGLLDPGESISAIAITNASANFSLTFTSDSTAGDGVVSLGNITSDKAILGIYTVGSSTSTTDFQLGSFVGTTLSAKGAINVSTVLGNSSGVALRFSQGLAAKTSVNVQNDLTGDIIVGTTASQNLAGTINVGGNILEDGDGSVISLTGAAATTSSIRVGGNVDSDLNVTGVFSGVLTVGGDFNGAANFANNVATTARLQAASWADVNVQGNLSGQLTANFGDIDLFVKKNIDGTAVVVSDGDITLDVDGTVLGKSMLDAAGSISGSVAGSLASRLTADGDISLDINGALGASTINASGALNLDVATTLTSLKARADGTITITSRGIASSNVTSDSSIVLSVTGPVSASNFNAADITGTVNGSVTSSLFNTDGEISLAVVGSVTSSRILSGSAAVTVSATGNVSSSTIQSLGGDLDIDITGNLATGRISGDSVDLTVGGSTTSTRIHAAADLTIDINGGLTDSTLNAVNSATVDIGTGMLRSTLTTDQDDVSLTLGAGIADSHVDAGGDLSINAGGNLLRAHLFAFDDVTLDVIAGNLDASVATSASGSISADIGGAISKTNFIAANGDITLSAAKTLVDVDVHAGETISADITGAATRAEFLGEGDLTIDVGGSLTDSEIDSASGNVAASVGLDLLGTRVTADGSVSLDVTRNMNAGGTSSKRLFAITSGDNVTLDVGGSILNANVVARTSAIVAANGSFNGSISTDQLDFAVGGVPSGPVFVSGGVSAASVIQAETVLDLDGDDVGFFVGGNFDGMLDVSGSFATGTGAVATAINGQVGVNARLNLASIDEANSATELVFGSLFRGEFNLDEDLDVDLTFNGNVDQINIAGQVNQTIKVNGKLTSLSTGSTFSATSTFDGDFEDSNGVVTGNLDTTTGFVTILP